MDNKPEGKKDDPRQPNRVPLLFVDVNFGTGMAERIVVYDGDTSDGLANKFAIEHNLDQNKRNKLKLL